MHAGIIYGTTDQKTAENLIKGLKQGQSIEEITWIDDDGYLDDSEEGLEPGHWYNLSARLKKLKRNQKCS